MIIAAGTKALFRCDGGFFSFSGVGGDISYLKDQGTVMEQPNPSQKDGCWLPVEEPSRPASLTFASSSSTPSSRQPLLSRLHS